MSDNSLSHLPARLRPLRHEIESILQGGGLLNHDPPLAEQIARCFKLLSSDWQPFDLFALNETDVDLAVALQCCLKSGFVKVRFEATAFDSDLQRSATFGVEASGDYRSIAHQKLKSFWSPYNSSSQSNWEFRLTAEGAGAKLDVEAGGDRCRRACQSAFYLRATPLYQCLLKGTPTGSQVGSAVAIAQANPVINIKTPPPTVIVNVQPVEANCRDIGGDNGDTNGDKKREMPTDPNVVEAIRHINDYRREVKAGTTPKRSRRKLIEELFGEQDRKEVDRIYRELNPSRHGISLISEE